MGDEKLGTLLSTKSFLLPDSLVESAWVEHASFAFWLVDKLAPKVFVELGCHNGFSYFTFCQAVLRLELGTACYAIDTWEGDEHSGLYDGSVFESVHKGNDRYRAFSTLMPMKFSDALQYFPDKSIDLLHIDGRHFYDDVREDFENWLPKISEAGIAILHDTNVRERNFGVWRFFAELKERFPTFEFIHGHGLGVVAVGKTPDSIADLFAAPIETRKCVQTIYSILGNNVRYRQSAEMRFLRDKHTLEELSAEMNRKTALEKILEEKSEGLTAQNATLNGQNAMLTEQSATLNGRHATLTEQNAALIEQRAMLTELTAENAHLGEELSRLSRESYDQGVHLARLYQKTSDALESKVNALVRLVAQSTRDSPVSSLPRYLKKSFPINMSPAYRTLLRDYQTISKSPLFDRDWYVESYKNVEEKGEDPVHHFLKFGCEYTLSPGPLFDAKLYMQQNPDVKERGDNPLLHFIRSGSSENRDLGLQRIANEPRNLPNLSTKAAEVSGRTGHLPVKMPDLYGLRIHQPTARIVVVLHIYYPDVADELLDSCKNIPEDFDLVISLVEGRSDFLKDNLLERFPRSQIYTFENRGRDILPFMAIAATGCLFRYSLICKLHTKKSPHRDDGDGWRRHLVEGILPSVDGTKRTIEKFDKDRDVGLVVADGQVFQGIEYWLGNLVHTSRLVPMLGLNEDEAYKVPFAGGSMFWLRPFLLYDLVGLAVPPETFESEPLQIDGSLAHTIERFFSLSCASAGMRILTTSEVVDNTMLSPLKTMNAPRAVAFYLPQFHPIPENDLWWGQGFTEWANVTKARPLFEGHRQPRLPGELGFTDLRLSETRQAQADLARSYGIEGFCYYYYWFSDGRRLLERPLREVLKTGQPDFPFMICWANEPWSRNWDGHSKEVLLAQDYPDGWESKFADDIAPILSDERYIRLEHGDRPPVLLIYRIMHLPKPKESVERLRHALGERGLANVHIAAGWLRLGDDDPLPEDPGELGLDAYFEFPPHQLPNAKYSQEQTPAGLTGGIYNYAQTVDANLAGELDRNAEWRHRAVMMGWDNTARRGNAAHIFHGATPAHFRRWLRGLVKQKRCTEERLLFINAWNEWAEGSCLEPDRDFGRGWLEAVQSALALPTGAARK